MGIFLVPITLIQNISAGPPLSSRWKKVEKLPSECFSLHLCPKDDDKKKGEKEKGEGKEGEDEWLVFCFKDNGEGSLSMNITPYSLWMDGLKILVEGTNAICSPKNLETIKHLQRIGKEVGSIQEERSTFLPPIPLPPADFNFYYGM